MKPKVRKTGKSSIAAKNQSSQGKLSWRRPVDENKVSKTFVEAFGDKDPLSFQTGKRYSIKY